MMRVMLLWSVVSVALASVSQGQEPAPVASQPTQFDLAISGLDKPLRVRLSVSVNGKPWGQHYEEVQRQYLQLVFAQLDGDRNGSLSASEAKGVPPPRSWATLSMGDDVFVAFNFKVLDGNGDGQASAAEFEQYARAFGNAPVRLLTAPAGQANDNLFRALDANRDRTLQPDEWAAADKLMEKDRDSNRVLTAEELRGPMPIAMPPEFVAGDSGVKRARQPLKLELKAVTETAADAEFIVDYAESVLQTRRPQVQIKVAAGAADLGLKVDDTIANEPVLVIAGRRLVLRVPPPAVRLRSALQQQLRNEFESVAERTEQAVPASATMPQLLKSIHRIADRNDDGKLEAAELDLYVNGLLSLQVAADAARLRLVESGERPGLMPFADANLDSRISRRELQSLAPQLTKIAGEAAKLTRDDLPPTLILVLQHGPFNEATGQNPLENAGPPWFFRADRNQDGDLDREEFLGTPEDFKRLDANGDGWIELDEAILGDPAPPAGVEEKK